MTVLRAAVRGHWTERSLSDAVARINRTVCQNVPSNKYVTFFMASLDPASGKIEYVNAGHNPPLLVRTDGTVEKLEEGGMVLGMFEGVPYAGRRGRAAARRHLARVLGRGHGDLERRERRPGVRRGRPDARGRGRARPRRRRSPATRSCASWSASPRGPRLPTTAP